MYPKFSLILILLFLSFVADAQIWDYSYTHYGKEDGLPSNTVYCMVEDKDGIMWIGTDAGLVRFDGSHFKTYTTADGLPSNDVFYIVIDFNNRIWLNTQSVYSCFIKNDNVYTSNNSDILKKLPKNIRVNLVHNNKIYFLNDDFILTLDENDRIDIKYKPSNVIAFHFCKIVNNKVLTVSSDYSFFDDVIINPNRILREIDYIKGLVQTKNGVYYLSNNKIRKIDSKFLFNLKTKSPHTLLYEYDNKVLKINFQGITVHDAKNPNKIIDSFLMRYPISFVSPVDKKLGIATLNNGFYILNNKNTRDFTDLKYKNRMQSVHKFSNFIWLGNDISDVYKLSFDNNNQTILKNIRQGFDISSKVKKIISYKNYNFLLCEHALYHTNSEFKKIKKIDLFPGAFKNIYVENQNLILLSNRDFYRINLSNFKCQSFYILKKRLYSYHSFQGKEIIGAEDGLYYLKNDSLIPYPLNIPFHVRVMEITSKDSFLIVATINKGIFVINNHHVVANIDKSVGLSSNCCFRIKHYKDNLVIATNNGINFYNYTQHSIGKVFESDGLASNVVNDIDIDADTLYAATENGLSSIIIPEINFNKNFTIFSKPTIINRDSIWTKDSVFHTRTNYAFNFMLHSLTFGTKGNVKFYYQVDNPNVENGFIETSDQFIRFKFPKPGLYPINIYAKDVNDNISKQLKFMVYVDPYFSQTKTYYVVLIFTALVISSILYYAIYRYMKFRDGMQGVQKELIQKLQLKSWQSQMNPHYLFNSLNALQYMFLSSDAEQAKDFMMNFSTMLRKTIDQSKQMFTTVEIEIQYIEGYLNLEREKRKQPFDYQIIVSNQSIYKLNIPTLLIQPVLENSIKHGINFRADGLIMIHFSIENDCLTVSIQDNGSGLQPKPHNTEHQSIGLKLIQDKIEIVENYIQDKIFYSLDNKIENGKVIGAITIFKFPLNLHNK